MATRTLFALLLLAGGCASTTADNPATKAGNTNAIVIRNAAISGSVLEAIRTHVPAARITTDRSQCPRIVFRGELSALQRRDPSVYIDRTLMGDTCILNSILAQDVDYLEVYPSGLVSDGTIQRNPAGVIIIYRRKE